MPGKFELFTDKSGQYRYRLIVANGEMILMSSCGVDDKSEMLDMIAAVKRHAANPQLFEMVGTSSAKHYFVLKDESQRIIGMGGHYSSTAGCDAGVKSVGANAPSAPIHDATC